MKPDCQDPVTRREWGLTPSTENCGFPAGKEYLNYGEFFGRTYLETQWIVRGGGDKQCDRVK
jgi:hypothetical protein